MREVTVIWISQARDESRILGSAFRTSLIVPLTCGVLVGALAILGYATSEISTLASPGNRAMTVRVLMPARIFASWPASGGAPLGTAPAGSVLSNVEAVAHGGLRVCITLGNERLCGYLEAARTNWSPSPSNIPSVRPPQNQ
jgi:hypothetical protein